VFVFCVVTSWMLAIDHSGVRSLTSVPKSRTRKLDRTGAALRSTTGVVGSSTAGSGAGTGSPVTLASFSRLRVASGSLTGGALEAAARALGNGSSALSRKALPVRAINSPAPNMKSRFTTQKFRLNSRSTVGGETARRVPRKVKQKRVTRHSIGRPS